MTSIIGVTHAGRATLLQQEAQTAAHLRSAHASALHYAQPAITAYLAYLGRVADAQGHIPVSEARGTAGQRLAATLTHHIDGFGATAHAIVTHAGQSAAVIGSSIAAAQLHAALRKGKAHTFATPPGTYQQRAAVPGLFSSLGSEAGQRTRDAIARGILLGASAAAVGADIAAALAISQTRAILISRNESVWAYRDATLATYRANSDTCVGWTWLAFAGACIICSESSGDDFPLDEEMESHIGCQCVQVPRFASSSGLDGGDVPDGSAWFAEQSADYQRSILGPAKYAAWVAGAFALADLIGTRSDPTWGTSRYEKSLKQMGLDASDYDDEDDE